MRILGDALRSSNTTPIDSPGRRRTGNRFIDTLPDEAGLALGRRAELRVFAEGATLARRGDPIREVHFPASGAIGQLEEHDDGRSVEIAAVGTEGISGFEVLLGEPHAQFTRVTNVPVAAFALDAGALSDLRDRFPVLRARVERYAVLAMRLAGISAACERHHLAEARLARWLLQLYEHAGTVEIAVTHERAALMLSLQRAGVTRAYARVAHSGAIRIERGRVRVLDPAALLAFACGCHAEAKAAVEAFYRPEDSAAV